jgi:hypothetical protein
MGKIMLEALAIVSIPLILFLGIYLSAVSMAGHEVAKRTTFQVLFILSLFTFITFVLYLTIGEKYSFVTFQFLASVIVTFCSLSLSFWKKKSGALLLDIGKNEFWASLLLLGLMHIGLTISDALSFFRHLSVGFPQGSSLVTEVSGLAFYASLSIWWILLVFSKTEFRKNGIWFGIRLIKWQRIKSYRWEPSKPNILTIRYTSFPLFLGWMSFPIPPQYREDVSRILNDRLPNENL